MTPRLRIMSLVLLFVALTTAAQDVSLQQRCRRGTPRPQHLRLRAAGGQQRQPGGDFYQGERHQLTVLVAFSDRAFQGDEAATLAQWDLIFNTERLSESPFVGSVRDYFSDQSDGLFRPVFDLQYVEVGGSAERYASTQADDENSQYLVQDIMQVLATRDIDWSQYDWNGDGYVNQLLIIYAGHGMNDSREANLIWPHQWWMSEHLKDGQQGQYCDPIAVTAGDRQYQVDCYCALAELTRNNDYGSFGTICHEYSHCFGLPDFYYSSTSYVRGWDLMDSGNYNGGGYRPAGYSAHERWLMGWTTPKEITATTTVSGMPARDAYLVRNDGCDNEYYVIENRQPTGWDASLPGSGIVVFHIDYDPAVWCSTTDVPNHPAYTDDDGQTVAARQRYVLFHANNANYSYAGWAYPYNGNNQLTNTSTPAATLWNPNSDGTLLLSKPINGMAVADGAASFTVTISNPTAIRDVDASAGATAGAAATTLYRYGPVRIQRMADGSIRKVISQ